MMNGKTVDYLQAVRDYDQAWGKKPNGFDYLLRSSEELEVVDYLKVIPGVCLVSGDGATGCDSQERNMICS